MLSIRLIELQYPNYQVEMIGDEELKITRPSGDQFTMYLTNMLAECAKEGRDYRSIVSDYVNGVIPEPEEFGQKTLDKVLVLVRDERFLGISASDRTTEIAVRHLVADLWEVVAYDLDHSITTLSEEDCKAFHIPRNEVFDVGIGNVAKLLEDLAARPYQNCHELCATNLFHVSGALLMGYVWEQIEKLVDGDVVLGVPARDTVVFCGSKDTIALQQLRNEVDYVMRNGHHLITETLLRRVDGKWQAFS